MKLLSYFIGMLSGFAVIGAVTVYGFDTYERMWGRFNSFQVIMWVAFVASAITGFAFSVTSRSIRATERINSSLMLGASSAAVLSLINYVLSIASVGKAHTVYALFSAVLVGVGAALVSKRLNA